MIGYFTTENEPVKTLYNLDAIDIIAGEYRIAIRIGGVSIYKRKEAEEIVRHDLDLTE